MDRFEIEFILFDKGKPLSKRDRKIRDVIFEETKNVLKHSLDELTEYKFLDRFEPGISSPDEKKQLRMSINTNNDEHSVYFNQDHCTIEEYFTIGELKHISIVIKNYFEIFLGYEIDTNIFLRID